MPRAVIMTAADEPLQVVSLDIAPLGADQVRLAMAAAGVCHSDLHVYNAGAPGIFRPLVLGHEGAGEVIEVGANVTEVAVGDHVVLSGITQCGECGFCVSGQPTLCAAFPTMRTGALPDGSRPLSLDGEPVGQMGGVGCWTEEAVVHWRSAVKIDQDMPLVPAALLGCGVITGFGAVANVGRVRAGDTMAVIGCGGLGLSAIQAGRIAGAERIIAVDVNPGKLALAARSGATDVVNAADGDPVEQVRALTGGAGTMFAFDFVGVPETARNGLAMTRPGGTLVLSGLGAAELTFSINELIRAGRTIKGNFAGMGTFGPEFAKLIKHYQDGALQLDALVSKQLDLSEVQLALDSMSDGAVARSVLVMAGPRGTV
ncbi:MAG: zinc-binding dehydrogenase [Trebonia sp.]|jgi:Zn-dependent alcohol dehydrogenase